MCRIENQLTTKDRNSPADNGRTVWANAMPVFCFRTRNGETIGASDACEFACRDAAWNELTRVCSDLAAEGCRGLKQDSEWSIELLDATQRPLFRIRLIAETVG